MNICQVPNCDREAHHEYCRAHLERLSKSGELRPDIPLGHSNGHYFSLFDDIAQIVRDREQPWRAQAACLDMDIEHFFPFTAPGKKGMNESPLTARARIACGRCPVADECRSYAEDSGSEGIWAGQWFYHPHVRERMRKQKEAKTG